MDPTLSASHRALEPLVAGLLAADPAAELERSERSFRVKLGGGAVMHVLPSATVSELEADVELALADKRPAVSVHFIALAELEGARQVLETKVSKKFFQLKLRPETAHLWSPTAGVTNLGAGRVPPLEKAHAALASGAVHELSAIGTLRETQAEDASAFLLNLQRRPPVVTAGIAVLSVVLFALQWAWGDGQVYLSGMRMGAALRSLIGGGEWWRLFAPMVLHGSLMHLLFNMLALFSFGAFLERFLGWRRFALLFVASGLGGGVMSALRPEDTVSVGASGGIWGLMIAGAVLMTFPRGRLPDLVVARQRSRVWGPVAMNAFYSFQPGVDLLAHLGGGIIGGLLMGTGLLLAGIPLATEARTNERPPAREPLGVTLASVGLLAALAGSLVFAFVTGHPWELRQAPSSSRVELAEERASIELPHLAAGLKRNEQAFVFGSLMVDPIAVIVSIEPSRLTEGQARDVEGSLQKSLESLAPEPLEGFSVTKRNELKHTKDGRPYLFAEQQSADGRRADSVWLVEGDRIAHVLVLVSSDAVASWRETADRVPFSLELRN